jgi:hypothetical protein
MTVEEDSTLSFTDFQCPPDKFGVCGAVQLITRDNGDLSVLQMIYTLRLSVRHGRLSVGLKDGLTFTEGTGDLDRSVTFKAGVRPSTVCISLHAQMHTCMYMYVQ